MGNLNGLVEINTQDEVSGDLEAADMEVAGGPEAADMEVAEHQVFEKQEGSISGKLEGSGSGKPGGSGSGEPEVSTVVERYTLLERITHLVHLLSMFLLLITGLKIYLGWDFMLYEDARALHMLAVPFFLAANWVLVPYNVFSCEGDSCELEARIIRFVEGYIFGPEDLKRLHAIVLNFFGKGEYPAFTVYDARDKHYITKLHPLLKLLIILESTAIFLVAVTGIVLYDPNWSLFGIPVAQAVLAVFWAFAPYAGVQPGGLIRVIHLASTYWFIFELTVHVGILEFDPKVWKYHKAIFWSGKEDLSETDFVEVLGKK